MHCRSAFGPVNSMNIQFEHPMPQSNRQGSLKVIRDHSKSEVLHRQQPNQHNSRTIKKTLHTRLIVSLLPTQPHQKKTTEQPPALKTLLKRRRQIRDSSRPIVGPNVKPLLEKAPLGSSAFCEILGGFVCFWLLLFLYSFFFVFLGEGVGLLTLF